MVARWIRLGVVLAAGGAWSLRPARAAVGTVEDLAGCSLPNGVVVLPAVGTGVPTDGTLLKISTMQMTAYPESEGGRVLTRPEILSRIRDSKTADLAYLPDQNGLWAFSGCITEESGDVMLSDASGQKLDIPMELPQTSRNLGGLLTDIAEGHIYLLKTTDGRYALIRVLELNKSGMVLQYVYQNGAGTAFDIPRHPALAYKTPAGFAVVEAKATPSATAPGPVHNDSAAAASPDAVGRPKVGSISPMPDALHPFAAPSPTADTVLPPAPALPRMATATRPMENLPEVENRTPLGPGDIVAPGVIMLTSGAQVTPDKLESTMVSFNTMRNQMIQRRIEIIKKTTTTNLDIDTKAQAIRDLPMLKAGEAADVLVDQISFLYTRSGAKEFSPDALHPCVAALKQLGKPAVDAAIRGLEKLDLDGGDGIDSGRYKAELLSMVVESVEGKDVAVFLFKKEMDHASDPKVHAVFAYLLSKADTQ